MNRKFTVALLLGAFVVSTVLSGAAFAEEAPKSDYTIPSELTPVREWKNGISPEKVQEYRQGYRSKDFLINGDQGNYCFLNIPEFYQTATVYRGAGQVAMLEKKVDESLLNTMTDTDLGKMPLRDLLKDEQARIQGLLVIHDGKIVLEEYPGMRELDKHCWFSASKQLLGLTVHILEEEGLIDLEQTVTHYIPEYNSDDWKKVKVKDLLHHNSGMDYVETNANFMNPEHPLAISTANSLASRFEKSEKSAFDILKDVKSYIEPGVKYDYASPNTQILGFIVERVTGEKFEDVVADRIWTRTGMESDGQYALSAQGEPLSAGIFTSRLRDFGRFALLYTPSWNKVADKQIVSDTYWAKVYDKTYADALKRGVETDKSKYFKDGQSSHATYQWDLVFTDGDLFKAGRYGQGIYVSPETNTVVVWFSSVYMNKIYFPGFARDIVKQVFRKEATDTQQKDKAPVFSIKDTINGFSAEDNRRFKQEFGVAAMLSINPTALWFHSYASRGLPTAVIPRRQPVMPLHSKIIPEVGNVTVTTDFGKMDLNAFLNHPKSFAQEFIVVHKGKIVFEQYPGMRRRIHI